MSLVERYSANCHGNISQPKGIPSAVLDDLSCELAEPLAFIFVENCPCGAEKGQYVPVPSLCNRGLTSVHCHGHVRVGLHLCSFL